MSKKKRRRRRIKKKNKRNNNNEKVAGEGFGGWRGERGRGEKPSKTEGDRLKEKRGYNFRTQLQQITAFFFLTHWAGVLSVFERRRQEKDTYSVKFTRVLFSERDLLTL